MAEIKRRIVLASVLKPVNDTRMFEKLAFSLAAVERYEVHVIGFPSGHSADGRVTIHALPNFSRLSWQRIKASWHVLLKFIQLKPALIIITTHELLVTAIIAKLITGSKLMYDVQENYSHNIRYTHTFPSIVRFPTAIYVRWKERLSSFFVDHFLLAEKIYQDELPFVKGRSSIFENKARKPMQKRKATLNEMKLLFTGTLSRSTGVFKAIELAVKMHAIDPSVTLTIIGYCAIRGELSALQSQIEKYNFIHLIGGDRLVPHDVILDAILTSNAGIIAYEYSQVTHQKTPTKLYEYLAYQLPIIITSRPTLWSELCRPFHAAITVDFEQPDAAEVVRALKTQDFYTSLPSDMHWESEENRLQKLISIVLD